MKSQVTFRSPQNMSGAKRSCIVQQKRFVRYKLRSVGILFRRKPWEASEIKLEYGNLEKWLCKNFSHNYRRENGIDQTKWIFFLTCLSEQYLYNTFLHFNNTLQNSSCLLLACVPSVSFTFGPQWEKVCAGTLHQNPLHFPLYKFSF